MKRFEKFTHQQFRSLIRHLKKYDAHRESEMLHRIRVDIKKLKAILSVINACKKRFRAHKNFLPLRDIFRKAGVMREPDVLARLLVQYQVVAIDKDRMSHDHEELSTAFVSEVPGFISKVKRLRNKLEADIERVHRDELERYLHRKRKEIRRHLYPKPQMRILHKTRKEIKEVIYISEAGGKLKKRERKFYAQIQDIMGTLHDKQMLLDLLKKKNDPAGYDQSMEIKSGCLSDKEDILRLVVDFYRSHS